MAVPPATFGNDSTVTVQQLTESVGVAAPNLCMRSAVTKLNLLDLIHFTMPSSGDSTAQAELENTVNGIFDHL